MNLVSNRRPDQIKLVGRVTIDLAQVIHSQNYARPADYKLEYCSVNASVRLSAKAAGKKLSLTSPDNFDRDSFSDLHSFVGIHKDSSKQRSFEEAEKTVEMHWKAKAHDSIHQEQIIEE